MSHLLSTYTTSRDNNFNLIRAIAASLVLFSHSFALALGSSDFEPLRSTIGMTWGMIAVDIFFVSSGFLITSSYISKNNIIAFVWARVLRIYPALIVATLFCVFIVGLWFTDHTLNEYLSSQQTLKHLIKNSILFFGVDYRLPGVFMDVPYKEAVNGSLWTLPYEVKMYAILALIFATVSYLEPRKKLISVKNAILAMGLISIAANVFNHFHPILPQNFIRLFSMFFVGAAFYVWQDKIRLSPKYIVIGLPLLILSSFNKDVFFVLYCLLLPFIIFYLAYVPSGLVRNFNKFGDYSYGIYIYAFPVQQSIAATVPSVSVPAMIVLSFTFTLVLAMISWHVIEKRFLKMKNSYKHIENFIQRNWLTKRFTRIK